METAKWVLVVDDEDDVRKALVKVLAVANYTVMEAASGDEALMLVREKMPVPPRLSIVDVVMPGENGVVVSRELREFAPGMQVILILGGLGQARSGISAQDGQGYES